MYMLKSVGDRTPPCGNTIFELTFVLMFLFLNVVYAFASFDVVCDEFKNGVAGYFVWCSFVCQCVYVDCVKCFCSCLELR